MMRNVTKTIFAALLVAFVFSAVLIPRVTPVFAATQSVDEQPKAPAEPSKDGDKEHSGHH